MNSCCIDDRVQDRRLIPAQGADGAVFLSWIQIFLKRVIKDRMTHLTPINPEIAQRRQNKPSIAPFYRGSTFQRRTSEINRREFGRL